MFMLYSCRSTTAFDYLLDMPILNFCMDKKDELVVEKRNKVAELTRLLEKEPSQIWLDDLNEFLEKFDEYEELDKKEKETRIGKK